MKGPLRALIVEDEQDDCDLLVRELRNQGYELDYIRVDTAEAMEAALDTRSWDIVFSDWGMPRFSAIGALTVLQKKAIDLPFIIVSGTIGEETAVEALRSGAHDFLLKRQLVRLVPAVERELREAKFRRERHKMQEQLMISDRMASVGILAAGVAHEINNPLAAVLANLDMAVRDLIEVSADLPETPALRDLRDELRDARDATDRIRNIVRDLKLFSRSDDEVRTSVDIPRVLESTLRMACNEIRHRAKLVKNLQPVPRVEANESRLGQVFLNLVINAAQAIPEGRADTNQIRVATSIGAGGRVVVEIGDTGSGMSPDVLKRLFTPFFTTKSIGVGTGLGLSICYRIVNEVGGEITVESSVGVGSTFRVHLPPATRVIEGQRDVRPSAAPPIRRGRILLIDDEPLITSTVRRALGHEHEVTAFHRAHDALASIVGGERFDTILCDLMMPEMTGMDLYAELKHVAPDQSEKMIFLTGGAFTSRARTFLDEVPNLRLEKPFDARMLRALVNERVK